MLQLLVVALLASGVVGEDAELAPMPIEAQAAEAAKDVESTEQKIGMPSIRNDQYDDHHDYRQNDHLYLKAKLDGHRLEGPVIARTLHSSLGHGPNIAAQDEIIRFTYSPAYYQPTWVLDYRFLKSGGRRYTRGPGGQILILPRSYKQYPGDGTHDYDSYIEHLRLKLIAEQNKRMREHGFSHVDDRGHDYGHDDLEELPREQERERYREQERLPHREQEWMPYRGERVHQQEPMRPIYVEREREHFGREHRMFD